MVWERSAPKMELFRNPKINFMGAMKPAFVISMLLITASIVSLLIHGDINLLREMAELAL